jgi:hypothetical protein
MREPRFGPGLPPCNGHGGDAKLAGNIAQACTRGCSDTPPDSWCGETAGGEPLSESGAICDGRCRPHTDNGN